MNFTLLRRMPALVLLFPAAVTITVIVGSARCGAQVSVLTQHNDIGRSGVNLQETALTTANVNTNTFGKLYSLPVDGQIYAQPLYVPKVNILQGGTTRNILFVATSHNMVYAFDADGGNDLKAYWTRNLGPFVPSSVIGTVNILEGVGVISTPVIDPASGLLYVCNKTYNSAAGTQTYHLHALDITTGKDVEHGPVNIYGTVPGSGYDSVNGMITFNAAKHLNRAGLLLLKGNVYIAFASHEDFDPYHGWLMTYNAKTLQQSGIYCTTANGFRGGIWQGGQGLASDGTSVFFMTGNGSTDVQSGGKDMSECFERLQLMRAGDLERKDWFVVHDFDYLNNGDIDLGSGGPLILPGTTWIAGGGKEGEMYLTKTTKMGKWGGSTSSDPQIQQEFSAWGGNLMGAPIAWSSPTDGILLYVWSTGDFLRCYQFFSSTGLFDETPFGVGPTQNPGGNSAPGALSISSNSNAGNSTILWATTPGSDPDEALVQGTLRAYDATNITHEIYDSALLSRDNLGNWAKFCPPTVANGNVYVGTSSDKVVVYGLLPVPAVPTGLKGHAGNAAAYLTWSPAAYATTYTVLRSNTRDGVYAAVATQITDTACLDSGLTNGETYYYEVESVNGAGTSAPSEAVAVKPSSSAHGGAVISINFIGGGPPGTPPPMAAAETAGVDAKPYWNNAGNASGGIDNLIDNIGFPSGSTANWSTGSTWSISISDTPGNDRMMKGYLDCSPGNPTTISVSGLPADFVSAGYSVYVYTAGDNNEVREGLFTIGNTTISATDPANSGFSGTFTQAAGGSTGNYVVFPAQTAASFTLTATPANVGSAPRAPVNGIQIVKNSGG